MGAFESMLKPKWSFTEKKQCCKRPKCNRIVAQLQKIKHIVYAIYVDETQQATDFLLFVFSLLSTCIKIHKLFFDCYAKLTPCNSQHARIFDVHSRILRFGGKTATMFYIIRSQWLVRSIQFCPYRKTVFLRNHVHAEVVCASRCCCCFFLFFFLLCSRLCFDGVAHGGKRKSNVRARLRLVVYASLCADAKLFT